MKAPTKFAFIALCAPLILGAWASQAAGAPTYDCTKPGNANKAACKTAAPATATPAAKKAMTYDCSKAGNANKAACKGVVAAAPPKPGPAPLAKATASGTPAARNYDCSKAGNANKAACKGVATPAPAMAKAPSAQPQAPVAAVKTTTVRSATQLAAAPRAAPAAAASGSRIVEWTTKTGKVVHYDCSKAGNANKQACK